MPSASTAGRVRRENPGTGRSLPSTGRAPPLTAAAAWWGAMAGVGALVHGVGEIAQGPVATQGLFVPSWTTGPIARNLGGEPGFTLLPTALASGIVTTVAAIALIAASMLIAGRRWGGWALVGLSAMLLLVGGGVGPPVIGLCAGAAAIVGRERRRGKTPTSTREAWLRTAYAWMFWTSLGLVVFLVFGSLFVALVLDTNASDAFVFAFLASVLVLPATIVVGSRLWSAVASHGAPARSVASASHGRSVR